MNGRLGMALVVSGPSGSGKSSICKRLLPAREGLRFSVSCTTRAARPGEVDGRDYYFLSKEDFLRKVEAKSSSSTPKCTGTSTAPSNPKS
jgi:guanylate kinase